MKWLARYATRVAVRRVVAILVLAFLAWAGIGRAEAACSGDFCDTLSEAWNKAQTDPRILTPASCANPAHYRKEYRIKEGTIRAVYGFSNCANREIVESVDQKFSIGFRDGCPVGSQWNDFLKKCDSECSTKPPLGPTIGLLQMEVCVGGCKYAGVPTKQISLESGPSGAIDFGSFSGFTPTGEQCGVPDQAKPDPYCAPINGQTVCVREDGSHCHKSPTTKRFFCWRPGETGEKADGPDVSKTNAGPNAIPPNVSLPNGDNLTPAGPPVTTTTNIGGNTTTTTTNNYTTEYGTNAAPGNGQGVGNESGPGDGKGEGDGDGDGDKGSVSGGGTCDQPPVCSGDALLCEQIRQSYMARCSAEDGINEFAGSDFDESMGTEEVDLGELIVDEDPDATSIDDSGFGFGRSCPSPPTFYDTTLDFDGMCNILQWIGALIAALGLLQGTYILAGET